MPSLDDHFKELKLRLKQGRGLSHSGDDPVYYLVFPPSAMLEVKRKFKTWKANLSLDGWDVHYFPMAEAIRDILKHNDLRDIWLEGEKDAPLDFKPINDTLADALMADDVLKMRLENELIRLAKEKNALLLITDLEALHPYLRVGALEQKLQGKFFVPTVILYPGKRTGRTNLKFLGIYPEDGNYRSVHIGD
jgi:hypothetical protein